MSVCKIQAISILLCLHWFACDPVAPCVWWLCAASWLLSLWNPIILIHQFSNIVDVFPTGSLAHREEEAVELFKDSHTPLTDLLYKVLVNGTSSGLFQCGGAGFTWKIHFSIPMFPSLSIPSSTINQGISGISSLFTVGHLWLIF